MKIGFGKPKPIIYRLTEIAKYDTLSALNAKMESFCSDRHERERVVVRTRMQAADCRSGAGRLKSVEWHG